MRGYFGIGIYQPKNIHNLGTLFRSAQCFGAKSIFTIGHRYHPQASDTTKSWRNIPLTNYKTFDEFHELLPRECKLIAIEINEKSHKLNKFSHPEQCYYLLGAEDYGIPEKILQKCYSVIEIPHTSHCLNVSVAGSIIMYDRTNKGEK